MKRTRRGTITGIHNPHGPEEIPFIRLRGHWLRKAGFEVGEPMTIRVAKSRLEIVPVPSIFAKT